MLKRRSTFQGSILLFLLTFFMIQFVWDEAAYADCYDFIKENGVNCVKIGSKIEETDGGIFSMKSFGDTLYLGMFGYNHKDNVNSTTAMMYTYNDKTNSLESDSKTTEVALGGDGNGIEESVYAYAEFNDQLYAATEDDGRVFRLKEDKWEKVIDSTYAGAFDLVEYRAPGEGISYLYALFSNSSTNKFEIQRSTSGNSGTWIPVHSGNGYMKDLVVYDNKLWAFSNMSDNKFYDVSSNGKDWARDKTPARFYGSFACGNTLWLNSSQKYGNKTFTIDEGKFNAGVYKYTTGSTFPPLTNEFVSKKTDNNYSTFKDIQEINGTLVVGASQCFKDVCENETNNTGDAALFASIDGGDNWEKIVSFEEESIWAVHVHNNNLYVGTMEYNSPSDGYGQLYKITVPKGTANCNSESFLSAIYLLLEEDEDE